MAPPLVGVLIGSRSDFNVMRRGLETLRALGVPYLFEFISPFRTPERVADFAREATERGLQVIIAASGGSSHVATQVSSYTNLPVIGVPIDSSPLRGQDALFSMVQTAPGVPIATVGINQSENAAILATQILALKYHRFRDVLEHRRLSSIQKLDGVRSDLAAEYPDLCDPELTAADPLLNDTENETASEATTGDSLEVTEPMKIWPASTAASASRSPSAMLQSLVSTPFPQEPKAKGKPGEDRPDPTASPFKRQPEDPSTFTTPPPGQFHRPITPLRGPGFVEIPVPLPEPEERKEITVETKIFRIARNNPDVDVLEHVMMVLLEGGVAAIPTDTVYGLAADATSRVAVERLYRLRNQETGRTMGVLIHHPEMLDHLVREIPPPLEEVIQRFWPGALTIILPKTPDIMEGVASADRIGVRIPNDRVCLEILARVNRPLAVRNAGRGSSQPITTAQPIIDLFKGHVQCILDGGDLGGSEGASTVLSALGEKYEILREGGVPRGELKAILGDRLKD